MKSGRSVTAIMIVLAATAFLIMVSCAKKDTMPSATPGAAAASPTDLEGCLDRIPKDATPGQRSMAEQTCKRNMAAHEAVVKAGTAAATSGAAAGSAGDTLEACMDRIPKDASAGQRLLSEGSCKRDEAGRQAAAAVPGP